MNCADVMLARSMNYEVEKECQTNVLWEDSTVVHTSSIKAFASAVHTLCNRLDGHPHRA